VYVRAANNEFGLNPIIDDIRKMEDEKYNSLVFEEYDEQFMYFLALAFIFFVIEMLIGDRRSKRHLFNR
jgi:Ca-activated chloride channel family protein